MPSCCLMTLATSVPVTEPLDTTVVYSGSTLTSQIEVQSLRYRCSPQIDYPWEMVVRERGRVRDAIKHEGTVDVVDLPSRPHPHSTSCMHIMYAVMYAVMAHRDMTSKTSPYTARELTTCTLKTPFQKLSKYVVEDNVPLWYPVSILRAGSVFNSYKEGTQFYWSAYLNGTRKRESKCLDSPS